MGEFKRNFYKTKRDRQLGIEQLQNMHKMPWFKMLKEDFERGKVFPALRYSGEVDFYYRGALLCQYKGNKNAEPTAGRDGEPFHPENLDAYEEFKKGCEKQSKKISGKDKERASLSELYRKFSPYIKQDSSMVLLDIEIGFPALFLSDKENYRNTQVDLLFLDKSSGTLYFIEAKDAGNKEIKRKFTGQSELELYNSLPIAVQLKKYDANLKNREVEILAAYQDYFNIMCKIFGCEIYSGRLSLYKRTKLLVYGKSTENGIQSLKAIRGILGKDLIIFENCLDVVDNLSERITTG